VLRKKVEQNKGIHKMCHISAKMHINKYTNMDGLLIHFMVSKYLTV